MPVFGQMSGLLARPPLFTTSSLSASCKVGTNLACILVNSRRKMKIFVIDHYPGEDFYLNETVKDSSTVIDNIDETMDRLNEVTSDTLVLITDSEPSVFYTLYKKIHQIDHPVKLLLLNRSKRYFMVGDNTADNTILYDAPLSYPQTN